ncbi:MAG: flavin reductase family protein [Bacteroidales bacterium]|nr:flavin reductase family protein [Bacteroidales bacterium]
MKHIDPDSFPLKDLHHLILGAVVPRPVALASTVDRKGNRNLSPFSFFNAFGINPPTLIFSPSRRGKDNTTKHTYENMKEVPEVVINAVTFDMVHQVSLASTEYPKGVDEFLKSGLTPLPSDIVKPFRVKESPVQFECSVTQIIETSDRPGAGNLVICRIVRIHIDEKILDAKGQVDPDKIKLVGRLGGDYYCHTSGDSKFIVPKPLQTPGIGIDSLPDSIKFSEHLTGNELGQLGNLEKMPSSEEILEFSKSAAIRDIAGSPSGESERNIKLVAYAKQLLSEGKPEQALKVLLCL